MVSVLSSLAASEVVLRMFVPQETKRLAVFDPDLGWRGKPNGEGTYIRRKDQIRVPFTYNGSGFRDEDISDTNNTGVQIVFLGDSFVESLEVPYESTFHDRLEEQIQRVVDSTAAVVNLSSQGYSTAQELLTYRKFKSLLRPSVVLVAFYNGNDFEDNLRSSFAWLDQHGNLTFKSNDHSPLDVSIQTLQRWLYENSHLVFFVKNTAENILHRKFSDEAKTKLNASETYRRNITQSLLYALNDEIRMDRHAFGVVIFPTRKQIAAGDKRDTDLIAAICEERSIPFLRLDQLLRPDHYFVYDEHLNEKGHAVAADEIYRFLLSSFSIPPTN